MQYFCVEYNNCGFVDKTNNNDKYKDLVCPICYSLLLKYPNGVKPIWERDPYWNSKRSDER